MFFIKIGNQWAIKSTTGTIITEHRIPTLFETKEEAESYAELNLPNENCEIKEYEGSQK